MTSEDIKHRLIIINFTEYRAHELRESRGGRPGFRVHNSPYGPCGSKATFEEAVYHSELGSCVKVEVAVLGS